MQRERKREREKGEIGKRSERNKNRVILKGCLNEEEGIERESLLTFYKYWIR